MALTTTVEADGKQIPFKASASIAVVYRNLFGRDYFDDVHKDHMDFETMSMVSYASAYLADKTVDPFEEWLDMFTVKDMTEVIGPAVFDITRDNFNTGSCSKKN